MADSLCYFNGFSRTLTLNFTNLEAFAQEMEEEHMCHNCKVGIVRALQINLGQALTICDNVNCNSFLNQWSWENLAERNALKNLSIDKTGQTDETLQQTLNSSYFLESSRSSCASLTDNEEELCKKYEDALNFCRIRNCNASPTSNKTERQELSNPLDKPTSLNNKDSFDSLNIEPLVNFSPFSISEDELLQSSCKRSLKKDWGLQSPILDPINLHQQPCFNKFAGTSLCNLPGNSVPPKGLMLSTTAATNRTDCPISVGSDPNNLTETKNLCDQQLHNKHDLNSSNNEMSNTSDLGCNLSNNAHILQPHSQAKKLSMSPLFTLFELTTVSTCYKVGSSSSPPSALLPGFSSEKNLNNDNSGTEQFLKSNIKNSGTDYEDKNSYPHLNSTNESQPFVSTSTNESLILKEPEIHDSDIFMELQKLCNGDGDYEMTPIVSEIVSTESSKEQLEDGGSNLQKLSSTTVTEQRNSPKHAHENISLYKESEENPYVDSTLLCKTPFMSNVSNISQPLINNAIVPEKIINHITNNFDAHLNDEKPVSVCASEMKKDNDSTKLKIPHQNSSNTMSSLNATESQPLITSPQETPLVNWTFSGDTNNPSSKVKCMAEGSLMLAAIKETTSKSNAKKKLKGDKSLHNNNISNLEDRNGLQNCFRLPRIRHSPNKDPAFVDPWSVSEIYLNEVDIEVVYNTEETEKLEKPTEAAPKNVLSNGSSTLSNLNSSVDSNNVDNEKLSSSNCESSSHSNGPEPLRMNVFKQIVLQPELSEPTETINYNFHYSGHSIDIRPSVGFSFPHSSIPKKKKKRNKLNSSYRHSTNAEFYNVMFSGLNIDEDFLQLLPNPSCSCDSSSEDASPFLHQNDSLNSADHMDFVPHNPSIEASTKTINARHYSSCKRKCDPHDLRSIIAKKRKEFDFIVPTITLPNNENGLNYSKCCSILRPWPHFGNLKNFNYDEDDFLPSASVPEEEKPENSFEPYVENVMEFTKENKKNDGQMNQCSYNITSSPASTKSPLKLSSITSKVLPTATPILTDDISQEELLTLLHKEGWIVSKCDPDINYQANPQAVSPTIVPIALQEQYANSGSHVVLWNADCQVDYFEKTEIQSSIDVIPQKNDFVNPNLSCKKLKLKTGSEIKANSFSNLSNLSPFHALPASQKSNLKLNRQLKTELLDIMKRIKKSKKPSENNNKTFHTNKIPLIQTIKTSNLVPRLDEYNGKTQNGCKSSKIANISDVMELPDDHSAYEELLKYGIDKPPPAKLREIHIPNFAPTPIKVPKVKPKKKLLQNNSLQCKKLIKKSPHKTSISSKESELDNLNQLIQENAEEQFASIIKSSSKSNEVPMFVFLAKGSKSFAFQRDNEL